MMTRINGRTCMGNLVTGVTTRYFAYLQLVGAHLVRIIQHSRGQPLNDHRLDAHDIRSPNKNQRHSKLYTPYLVAFTQRSSCSASLFVDNLMVFSWKPEGIMAYPAESAFHRIPQ